jgi:hypothetical protein
MSSGCYTTLNLAMSTDTTTIFYLYMINYSGSIIITQCDSDNSIIGTGTWNNTSSLGTSTTGQNFALLYNLGVSYNGAYGFVFSPVDLTIYSLNVTFIGNTNPGNIFGFQSADPNPTPVPTPVPTPTPTINLTTDIAPNLDTTTYPYIFYYLPLSCNGEITITQTSVATSTALGTGTWTINKTSATTTFPSTSGQNFTFVTNTTNSSYMLVNYNFTGDINGLVFSNVDLSVYSVSVSYTSTTNTTPAFTTINPYPLYFAVGDTSFTFNVYYYQNQTTTFFFTNTTSYTTALNLITNGWMVPYTLSSGGIQNTANNTYLIGAGTLIGGSGGTGGNSSYLSSNYIYMPAITNSINPKGGTSSSNSSDYSTSLTYTGASSPAYASYQYTVTTSGTQTSTNGWNYYTGGSGGSEEGESGGGGGGAAGYTNGNSGYSTEPGTASATKIYYTNDVTSTTANLVYSPQSGLATNLVIGQKGGNGSNGYSPTIGGVGGGAQSITSSGDTYYSNGGVVVTLLGFWSLNPSS